MNRFRFFISFCMIGLLTMLGSLAVSAASLSIDGIPAPVSALLIEDRTMVPLAETAALLDCTVTWNEAEIVLNHGGVYGYNAAFSLGSPQVRVTCKTRNPYTQLDTYTYFADEEYTPAPMAIDGVVFVPVRLFGEVRHIEAVWNSETQTADLRLIDQPSGTLFKAKTDGSARVKLSVNKPGMSMHNGLLYYVEDEVLYCTDPNAFSPRVCFRQVEDYVWEDGKLFLYGRNTLSVYNEEKTLLATYPDVKAFYRKDGLVLCETTYGTYFVTDLTAQKDVITDEKKNIIRVDLEKMLYLYDDTYLAASNLDGTGEEILLTDEEFAGLYLIDDMVYYVAKTDMTYRMHLDGSGKEIVYGLPLYYMTHEDGTVIFAYYNGTAGSYVYASAADGTGFRQIADFPAFGGVCEGDAVYMLKSPSGVYKAGLDGAAVQLAPDGAAEILDVHDGWVYYTIH